MWIIKYGDGRKLAGKTYRFVCPACKSKVEADETELDKVYGPAEEKFFKFSCPVCRCNRYVDPEKLGVCYEP